MQVREEEQKEAIADRRDTIVILKGTVLTGQRERAGAEMLSTIDIQRRLAYLMRRIS